MEIPFGKTLRITSIDSNTLVADGEWKLQFIGNAPIGWAEKNRIKLSESPVFGSKRASTDISTTRVQVENLDKKSAPITLFYVGNLSANKSFDIPSGAQPSIRKNIRLDRDAVIKAIYPGYIIGVEDPEGRLTKWQIDTTTATGRIQWFEGDRVVVEKGISETRFKIINKDRSDKSLGAVFYSEE